MELADQVYATRRELGTSVIIIFALAPFVPGMLKWVMLLSTLLLLVPLLPLLRLLLLLLLLLLLVLLSLVLLLLWSLSLSAWLLSL